jgi:NAD(P)-dependent dehydrogenase (short-subunit alcohol dehydrogenase family)
LDISQTETAKQIRYDQRHRRHARSPSTSITDMMTKQTHALVTGGTSGIGLAIAQTLNEEGLLVSIGARSTPGGEFFKHFKHPKNCQVLSMDVCDSNSVKTAFGEAKKSFGPVSVLINNAGQAQSAPFEKSSDALFEDMMNINLMGAVRCIQEALPDMKQALWGRIINVASTAGLVGYAYTSAYCASKHAVIGLTRSLALELAKTRITVNAVCPGFTDTPLVSEAIENITAKTGKSAEQALKDLSQFNPMGRLIKPQEVAQAVAWLASEGAMSINAQSIAIDGGETV